MIHKHIACGTNNMRYGHKQRGVLSTARMVKSPASSKLNSIINHAKVIADGIVTDFRLEAQ